MFMFRSFLYMMYIGVRERHRKPVATHSVNQSIQKVLLPPIDRLVLAVLFGSIAQGAETATSGIGLLLVSGELTLETVYRTLLVTEAPLGRRLSPMLPTLDEFRLRHKDKSGFVAKVLEKPHSILAENLGRVDTT